MPTVNRIIVSDEPKGDVDDDHRDQGQDEDQRRTRRDTTRLFDRAAEVTELTELERTGIHDKNGIDNAAAIDYLGEEITGLAGKLSKNIFREEHPAEYAQQKAEAGIAEVAQ